MSESTVPYLLQTSQHNDTIEQEHAQPLTTLNLEELARDLAKLERELIPLINRIRAMRNKRPVIVPKG